MKYYFLSGLIEELSFTDKPQMQWDELRFLLKHQLSATDHTKTLQLRSLFDIENILAFWKEEPINPLGTLSTAKEIEEALFEQDALPNYLQCFLEKYPIPKDALANRAELWRLFFEEQSALPGFLGRYFSWERQVRLVVAALRAKLLGIEATEVVLEEDDPDFLVAHILAQRESHQYEPPEEFAGLKEIMTGKNTLPLDIERSIGEWRVKEIERQVECDSFGIDRLLGYLAQYCIVWNWHEMQSNRREHLLAQKFLENDLG